MQNLSPIFKNISLNSFSNVDRRIEDEAEMQSRSQSRSRHILPGAGAGSGRQKWIYSGHRRRQKFSVGENGFRE